MLRRQDGTVSRTMRDASMLAVLVAFEGSMAAMQKHIPPDWLWLYPIIHMIVLMRIAYLRVTTSQGIQR